MWMERHILRGEKVTGNQQKGELVPKALSSFTCESWTALYCRTEGRQAPIHLPRAALLILKTLWSFIHPLFATKSPEATDMPFFVPRNSFEAWIELKVLRTTAFSSVEKCPSYRFRALWTCVPAQATPKTCCTENSPQTSLHCSFPTRPCGLNDSSLLSQGSECSPLFPGGSKNRVLEQLHWFLSAPKPSAFTICFLVIRYTNNS